VGLYQPEDPVRISTSLTFLLLVSTPAGPTAATTVLPFELLDDGSIIVPVTINGVGPLQFMLDTGSSRSAVSASVATRLRLPTVATSVMITPSGRGVRALASIERLALGGGRTVSVKAVVLPHDDYGARARVDGLIGQDVLAPLVYTIDYTRKGIVWDEALQDGEKRTRLALQVSDGRVLASLPQPSAAGAALQLIPDSGADGIVLFARGSRPPIGVTPLDVGLLRTLSGHRLVRRVLVDELRVGDVLLRNQRAVIVQSDQADTPLGDGLLPLHLFARVTFNGPGQHLVVEGSP
jgi:predicted aspartyl protease